MNSTVVTTSNGIVGFGAMGKLFNCTDGVNKIFELNGELEPRINHEQSLVNSVKTQLT